MWTMGNEYGFSMGVKRILLKDEVMITPEPKINFLDDDDSDK